VGDSKQRNCCSIGREKIIKTYCANDNVITRKKGQVWRDNMVYIPEGDFLMGSDSNEGFTEDEEGPVRNVKVQGFLMDPFAVTNQDFKKFVEDTGYITDAEKFGWSFVFHQFVSIATAKTVMHKVEQTPWWWVVEGACWNHPKGIDSTIEGCLNHPVVHVSWNDAKAYSSWANKRLPTETEWEYAARGGLIQQRFPWGNELLINGEHQCNIWQGEFPARNTKEDGYFGTAPVDAYNSNGYGLYNMSGNVWEWCENEFKRFSQVQSESKVIRGGSYLCHESYCNRYRVAARSSNTLDSSTGHMGFRCVADL